jgi:hypothetical protein
MSFEFLPFFVTPAKAEVKKVLKRLDTGFRRYDDLPRFRRNSKVSIYLFNTYIPFGLSWNIHDTRNITFEEFITLKTSDFSLTLGKNCNI